MIKIFKNTNFIFLIVLIYSCDNNCKNRQHSILYINNSPQAIEIVTIWNYPDTVITKDNPFTDNLPSIFPGEQIENYTHPKQCFEEIYKDGKITWDCIFSLDTINLLSWDTVRKTQRGLLERRAISLDYLIQNNFTITYP